MADLDVIMEVVRGPEGRAYLAYTIDHPCRHCHRPTRSSMYDNFAGLDRAEYIERYRYPANLCPCTACGAPNRVTVSQRAWKCAVSPEAVSAHMEKISR